MKDVNLILFPSSYFSVKQIEDDMKEEHEAARSIGFDTVLYGYDKWVDEDKLVLSEMIDEPQKAIMRGWMLKPESYALLYDGLLKKNVQLVTTPEEYALMHMFPNVYKVFGDDTAKMALYPLHSQIDVEELKKEFSRFMVKDYVKSVKGTEFPRYFDHAVTQKFFDNSMETFYKYRGDLLTGGICIKEFLDLKLYDGKTNEYRAFYANGEIISISRNSGQGNYTNEPPKDLIEKYKGINSCYYTVDYAELDDGTWKVMEAGDGSVSGLSEGQDYKQYYRALYHAFNK